MPESGNWLLCIARLREASQEMTGLFNLANRLGPLNERDKLADALEVYGNGIGHSEIEDGGDIARQALAKYNAAKDKT